LHAFWWWKFEVQEAKEAERECLSECECVGQKRMEKRKGVVMHHVENKE
jgi:hypothetical protein